MENSKNEMHLSISLDLGTPQGIALLAAITNAVGGTTKEVASVAPKAAVVDNVVKTPAAPATPAPATPKAAVAAPAPKAPAPQAAKPVTPAKPAAPAAPATPAPAKVAAPTTEDVAFDQLDEEAKREAIKTHITRHSKKGKTADIKALLTAYSVTKGSELTAEYLDSFFEAIDRYGKGESVEDILASWGSEEESLA